MNVSSTGVSNTLVKRGASIGSGVTLLCGITIGERAIIGAGSIVTKDVPPGAIVVGNPARVVKWVPGYQPAPSAKTPAA